ncbi:permease-like cell division protein FtsX [Aedoeadaptatus acetigenes]|uniref:Cell division protein FtsX n=1 Tax=Aedoeadaptatus acetigenes TaxID=2981723 RepID=A0ABV1J7W1_9FIRM|nr:permease-like cell division protein FtsX [Aedoeadaptatus acetigenes]MBS6525497.1 permease-like cell division protein FtsX [Peptoniphilaceae bacterium]MCU6787296.1 permease-like cell division protein FtsX [Aedoeadaptatus acetigenes]
MRWIRQFGNNIKEAFQGIARNKGMSLLSVISIMAVLVLFGVVVLLVLNMTGIVNETEKKVDKVVVYLNDDANEDSIRAIIKKAEGTGYVKDVSYTTKAQAWQEFSKNMELTNDAYFLEGMEENPLPASVTLQLSNIKQAKTVANTLQGMPGVYQVDYLNELIGKIVQINDWVRILGVAVVAILLIIAIVLIHNTIKSTIANRSQEIQIMKYIGASDGYIRRPLLIEGMFFGVVAGALALVLVYLGYKGMFGLFDEKLNVLMGLRLIRPTDMLKDMAIMFLCIGVGVGLIGSSLSLKRFLDV